MNSAKSISIIGLVVNIALTGAKVLTGIFTGSVAVLADGIHSGADVFSSAVTFWGINLSSKPADRKHPYGHIRYETVASFVVVVLLFLGAFFILFDAAKALMSGGNLIEFSFLNVGVMIVSALAAEIMARYKFKIGEAENSLVLVADAEHGRVDVLASVAVLSGVILVRWFSSADAILALLVGIYIIYESLGLTREVVESLVDTANIELEEKIKKLLKKEKILFKNIKTRKIGSTNFAEISLLCDPKAKIEDVDVILKNLENGMLAKFPELSSATLSVESHDASNRYIKPFFGKEMRFRHRGFETIGPVKHGKRTIIPLSENQKEIAKGHFGVKYYLLVDVADGGIVRKEIIENPYFAKDGGRGAKFAKSVEADKVVVTHIGESGRKNLESAGIEVEKVAKSKSLESISEETGKYSV